MSTPSPSASQSAAQPAFDEVRPDEAASTAGPQHDARVPPSGVLDELAGALASARASVSSFLDLASLEAKRASLTLMWMLVLAVVAAICIVAAWLGLMVALAMAAVSLGAPPVVAAFVTAIANLIGGAVLIRVCYGMSRNLLFAATRRQLTGTFTAAGGSP